MRQSKQLALMFLLGALLVGGALGFAADRAVVRRQSPRWGDPRAMRTLFSNELALDDQQRSDVQHGVRRDVGTRFTALLRPVRPQLDSVSDSANARIRLMLKPDQRQKFDALHQEMQAHARDSEKR